MLLILVNRLRDLSLSRNRVVRLTHRPDMTIVVYRDRKTEEKKMTESTPTQRSQFKCRFPQSQHGALQADKTRLKMRPPSTMFFFFIFKRIAELTRVNGLT